MARINTEEVYKGENVEKGLDKLVNEGHSYVTILYENENGYFSEEGYLEFDEEKNKFVIYEEQYEIKLAEFTSEFISSVHLDVNTIIIKEK